MEWQTAQESRVKGELLLLLSAHVPSPGSVGFRVDVVLPTGVFLPDIQAWANDMSQQQRDFAALTPMPNLWGEVCRLLSVLLLMICLGVLRQQRLCDCSGQDPAPRHSGMWRNMRHAHCRATTMVDDNEARHAHRTRNRSWRADGSTAALGTATVGPICRILACRCHICSGAVVCRPPQPQHQHPDPRRASTLCAGLQRDRGCLQLTSSAFIAFL